jgi:hypothetical protein
MIRYLSRRPDFRFRPSFQFHPKPFPILNSFPPA